MRWRGPPDRATPDTAISCSWSVPLDQPPSRTPARSPSCPVPLASRGAPRIVSVFGSERFLRPFDAAAQGVSPTNFKILWPSTNCPQFSQSYPPVDSNSPHEVHREPSAARLRIGPSRRRPGGRGAPAKPIGWRGEANGGWVNGRRADGCRANGVGVTGAGVSGGRDSGRRSGSAARLPRPRRGPPGRRR
jgi:hypothetical protein